MIPVAADERAQIRLVPVREDEMKIQRGFLPLPAVEDFVNHEETHLVGQFQQFRRRRIVTHANGVAAHLAQNLKLPLRRAHIKRRTQRAEIVVLIDAAQGDALTVDENSLVRIEPHVTDAEARFVNIC